MHERECLWAAVDACLHLHFSVNVYTLYTANLKGDVTLLGSQARCVKGPLLKLPFILPATFRSSAFTVQLSFF